MHTLPATLEIIERTPRVLHALLNGASDFWTTGSYGPGTWSARQVLGHLVIAERDDWMPRLRRILRDGESRPFDPFPHDATLRDANSAALPAMLDEFARCRAASLAELRSLSLSPTDLDRAGIHPALGRVTAAQLLATWAVHDLHHIRQIGLAMAWQYGACVGPWRAYLNTLHR